MANYRLSIEAKNDLIRIHQYGVHKFGVKQADNYFETFFEHFDRISENPYAFEAVDYINKGYRRCICGVDSIYFRITDNVVEIMIIIGRQDMSEKL